MTFDKSRVYTAVNAEELRAGSKVIGADTLEDLKYKVEHNMGIQRLKEIGPEASAFRFCCSERSPRVYAHYIMAYSVEEPAQLRWTDLKIGDIIRHKETGVEYMITGIDTNPETSRHVHFAGEWGYDEFLRKWEKVKK